MKDVIEILSDCGEGLININSTEGITAETITGKLILSEEPLEVVEEDNNTIQLIQSFYENRRG